MDAGTPSPIASATASICVARSGPGSMIATRSVPMMYVLVPSSVIGDGFAATIVVTCKLSFAAAVPVAPAAAAPFVRASAADAAAAAAGGGAPAAGAAHLLHHAHAR